MEEISRANRLSHARVHFVTDRESLLTDHRMSGRPIRASYKVFLIQYGRKLLTIHLSV